MRRLMEKAHLAPPTFESNRENNEFVARLLLHHFLDANDLEWLKQFESISLTDSQKQALNFVREVGAIDNTTYRQMANCDTLKASNDLRILRNNNFLKVKGKGKSTYYIPGDKLSTPAQEISTPPREISTQPQEISTQPQEISTQPQEISTQPLYTELPSEVLEEISSLRKKNIILRKCQT